MAKEYFSLTFNWGILADPISNQLRDKRIILPNDRERMYDKIKDHIGYLEMAAIFTDSQIFALRQRAQKSLVKEVEKIVNNMSDEDYWAFSRANKKKGE